MRGFSHNTLQVINLFSLYTFMFSPSAKESNLFPHYCMCHRDSTIKWRLHRENRFCECFPITDFVSSVLTLIVSVFCVGYGLALYDFDQNFR